MAPERPGEGRIYTPGENSYNEEAMKFRYNAPMTLSFTLLSFVVLLLDSLAGASLTANLFSIPGRGFFSFSNPFHYVRLFTHVVGHADWNHFMSNFAIILLVGPMLEEKYGSTSLLFMAAVTALVTGLLNVLLFTTGLLGASGVVFMMILLASFTNFNKGEIPLTFILIMVLYLGKEVWSALANKDNISQFAHVLGGLSGSFFGFIRPRKQA